MAERDLFSSEPEPRDDEPRADRQASPRQTPLAARMRPRTLDEYAGQQHILKPGMLLRRAIEAMGGMGKKAEKRLRKKLAAAIAAADEASQEGAS